MVTLGISTNTRLLGLGVITQGKLVDYRIHLYKAAWSASKGIDMILTSLKPCVEQYCITRVILSIPYVHHQTDAYRSFIEKITEYFEVLDIPIYTVSVEEVYSLWPPGQKKTKKEFMNELTLMYPQLTYCYLKEIKNKNKYYIKLFEAVAAAAQPY